VWAAGNSRVLHAFFPKFAPLEGTMLKTITTRALIGAAAIAAIAAFVWALPYLGS
jgi:hypothetical protein